MTTCASLKTLQGTRMRSKQQRSDDPSGIVREMMGHHGTNPCGALGVPAAATWAAAEPALLRAADVADQAKASTPNSSATTAHPAARSPPA